MEHIIDVYDYVNEPMHAFNDVQAEEETEASDTALTILELGELIW